jgi:thiamine pyrophosphate-dependent acetolactate synthase large subunit-like protein
MSSPPRGGGGPRRSELRWFAERLDVPVATTAAGKGVIAETHPLHLGTIGNLGLAAAHGGIADADLLLAVGTKLGATEGEDGGRIADQHLIGRKGPSRVAGFDVDLDQDLARRIDQTVGLVGGISCAICSTSRRTVTQG